MLKPSEKANPAASWLRGDSLDLHLGCLGYPIILTIFFRVAAIKSGDVAKPFLILFPLCLSKLTAAYSSKGTLEVSNAAMDAGGKRCLPTWMCESGAHKELRESGSGESRLPFRAQASKEASEKKAANKQGSMRAQPGCEGEKQTVNHSWPMKEVKLESLFPTSEDDGGLTVEDLVSIAKEYVNADEGKQHRHEANEERKSEDQDQRLAVFSEHPFGVLHGADRSRPQISKCSTTARSSCSIATDMVEDAPHRSISRTGDVAQDMLDVLLGPLLRIPSDGNTKELGKKT